jgi:hypothetical protein
LRRLGRVCAKLLTSLSRKECGVWSELIGVLLMRLGEGPYCAVLVAAADAEGDVVATFGLMTSVGDGAASAARTMTVLVEVAVIIHPGSPSSGANPWSY